MPRTHIYDSTVIISQALLFNRVLLPSELTLPVTLSKGPRREGSRRRGARGTRPRAGPQARVELRR